MTDRRPNIRQALQRLIVITLMAIIIGVIVSLAALSFIACVFWLNDALLISPRSRVQVPSATQLAAATILVPTIGGLIVGYLLQRYSEEKRPLGPPDSIRCVQLHQPLPALRAGLLSTLAAVVSLGCGASVGQYGPMVYLGSMAGQFTRTFIEKPLALMKPLYPTCRPSPLPVGSRLLYPRRLTPPLPAWYSRMK